MSFQSAAIIGSGNVATHIAKWLDDAGIRVEYVYSQTPEHAQTLAAQVGATVLTSLDSFSFSLDLVVIAVNDGSIESVSKVLPLTNALVVHTSGITSMDVLKAHPRYGVLYPLQTLSKTVFTQPQRVPLLVEAATESDCQLLMQLGKQLGSSTSKVFTEQRKVVHLAAVFANNFSNHLYTIASQILEKHQLPFDIIRPLIEETAYKVQTHQPQDVQTGPAKRDDQSTLTEHLKLLNEFPQYRELYELMSASIREQYKG